MPRYAPRMTRRSILPLRVLGSWVTKRTASGRSGLPSISATLSCIDRASSGVGACSGRGMTKTTIASPFISWGTPIAAASETAGCATAADSTSAGPTRLPAILRVSSLRPSMYQYPSSSMRAQSPWTQVFGNRDQYVWK